MTHQETLKCHHAAGMIIVRYGRRLRHAKHAQNAAAEDCSLDVRVPEMVAESLLIGTLSACLHIASTAPALSISLFFNRGWQQEAEARLPRQGYATAGCTVVVIDLHICLFCGMWFGSPAYLLVAPGLGFCAVDTRNG